MAQRLTDRAVARAQVKAKSYALWDSTTTGLSLKITRSGKRVWRFQTVYPGHDVQTRRTLGVYPALSLEAARKKAVEWHSLVKNDRDPQEVEEEKQIAAASERRAKALKNATTFAAVARRYAEEVLVHQRRGKKVARELAHLVEALGAARPIASITPADIRGAIAQFVRRTPYQARNIFQGANTLFRWAVHHDLLTVSPTASLSKGLLFKGAKVGPRQRTLNDEEIAVFWRSASKLGYPYAQIYRLLLLTACRHSEISKMRWSELHPEVRKALRAPQRPIDWTAIPATAKTLTIPATRFKSETPHVVPLTDVALKVLETVPLGGEFVFSADGGRRAVQMPSAAKAQLDRLMKRSLRALARQRGEDPAAVRLVPFIIHDLRRVVRSHLSALDIPDHVAEMVLGHGRRGLQRVYDQHKYEPQLRAALERWATRLHEIVTPPTPELRGGNVVSLKKKAG
jgi:integrase